MGLVFRTASGWEKKRPPVSLLLDINAGCGCHDLDAIDAVGQLDWFVELGIRIKRQEKRMNQKVKSRSAHRESPDFDARQMNGQSPIRGANLGGHFDRLLALDELRDEPVRFDARGVSYFEEIHERVSSRGPVTQFEPWSTKALRHDCGRLHAHPSSQIGRREYEHGAGLCWSTFDCVQFAAHDLGLGIDGRKRGYHD